MKIIEKLSNISMLVVPLFALYSAFKVYGYLGLIIVFIYVVIVFGTAQFYYDGKRRKIAFDDEEYLQKSTVVDLKELKLFIFSLVIPLSLIIIIYLYLKVEHGTLYALLYIFFFMYKTQLNLEVIYNVLDNKRYYSRTEDGTSIDELQEQIENLQDRLNELYDLTGFDTTKLLEMKHEKERVSIIHKLSDIDLEHNWINSLWQWADLVGVSEHNLPRNKDKLLEEISYHILSLNFQNMNIDTIPPEIGYLHTSTYLDCSMNNLIQIPNEIANITSLEELNLRLNEIKHIPSELENLKNLRTLDISSNRLINLPVEITNIPYLKELILHNNPIKSLPDELSTLKYITKVTVDSTVEVSSMIKDFLGDRLKIIDIGWIQGLWDWADTYKLDENIIPRDKTSLLNLETLKISPYDIAYVLSSSTLPSGYTRINIRKDSDITRLPKEIGNLINLKELYINNTRITRLPKEIGNLKNLEVLSIDNTNISELPIEIGNLKNLKKLLMRNTKIITVPTKIQDLKNLKIWSVGRNS